MKMVLLRVGIDSSSGKLQGPLFADGSFEFVPIPDDFSKGAHTYGNTVGRKGAPLLTYFPRHRQDAMRDKRMHLDPEFETFTYGDPTPPKAGLRRLEPGDMLVFYAGLEGWDHRSDPALYLVGYFVVSWTGLATELPKEEVRKRFGNNFHVRYDSIFRSQKDKLVLVHGGQGSRLLTTAHCISTLSTDKAGQPLKVLSPKAQAIFGDFGGKISIQRSPPRWVDAAYVPTAKVFLESLP